MNKTIARTHTHRIHTFFQKIPVCVLNHGNSSEIITCDTAHNLWVTDKKAKMQEINNREWSITLSNGQEISMVTPVQEFPIDEMLVDMLDAFDVSTTEHMNKWTRKNDLAFNQTMGIYLLCRQQ